MLHVPIELAARSARKESDAWMEELMSNVTIETYKDGDETGINDLFNDVFKQNRAIKEWEWKFKECPINARALTTLAKDEEKHIVGHYSGVSYYLKYNDSVVKLVQPVDTMVHEDHRGGARGVFVEMFLRYEDLLRQNGIDVGFGFPNRAAYIVGKRSLKYIDLFEIDNLSMRLARFNKRGYFVKWISRLIIRLLISINIRLIKDIQYKWVPAFDERINAFWKNIRGQYNIMVQRDFSFLNWRYCKKPGNDYRILQAERDKDIVGIMIVKFEDSGDVRTGYIMDCLASKESNLAENLVRTGLVFLSRNNVDNVFVRLSRGDYLFNIFSKIGFIPSECALGTHVVYKTYSSNVNDSTLRDSALWHISFGDCDSV
jgi:hypothetical protein